MKKIKKGLCIALTLTALTCCCGAFGISKITAPNSVITASAANLGEITISTHSGNNSWLSSSNRILFQLPSSVAFSTYSIESGAISLTRGGDTYTHNSDFKIEMWDGIDAWIEVSSFNAYLPSGTYTHEAGDYFTIDATFSNGTDSFHINAKVVINSTSMGDMYVEIPAIDAGYGGYVAEWVSDSGDGYLPKMYIKANAKIPAGTYKQVNETAVTLTRNGAVYNLPVGDYLTVGNDNNGTQQIDFTLWPFTSALGIFYVAQAGDVLTVDGQFTNGTVTFEIQKTEIENLADKAYAHSVTPVYTVTYLDTEGNEIGSVEARHNTKLAQPDDPTKTEEGSIHEFIGWFHGEESWDFANDTVSGDMTLSPKFTAVSKYQEVYVENTKASASSATSGIYFEADANAAAYNADWSLRYIPTTADTIKRINTDGTVTNVGNTGAETLVKYSETGYFIESWAVGGFVDGAIYVLDGTFKNVANQTLLVFDNVRITVAIDADSGSMSGSVSRSMFSMTAGASIRLNENSMGIRFEAEIGDSYDENASYYMMIVPKSYLTAFNITGDYYTALYNALQSAGLSTYIAAMECKPFQYSAEDAEKYGKIVTSWYIRGSLTTIQYHNMNTEFFAIAYKVEDGVYTYAKFNEGDNVRSIADVASKALNAGSMYTDDQKVILNGFVDTALKEGAGKAEDESYTGETITISATELVGYPVATQLQLNGIPDGADVYVAWSSSNPSVVAVDEYGNVLGVSSGSATITATYRGVSYTCAVTNMAGAKPSLLKDGSIVSWACVANVVEYGITVYDEYGTQVVYAGTVKNTCVDLTRLGLTANTQYQLFVTALYNDAATAAAKATFVYGDYSVSYVQAEDSALDLSVGVWNGSYHFDNADKLVELANAGVNLIIGINPVWQPSMENWINVLDVAYANGVSIIVDPKAYENSAYVEWDGSFAGTQNATNGINRGGYIMHPAIVGVIAFDEPTVDQMAGLDTLQATFNTNRANIGREDLMFFVNILGASASAGLAGDNTYDYAANYLTTFKNTVEAEVYSFDEYGIMSDVSDESSKYMRKSYYMSFDKLSSAAKNKGVDLWYTLLSAGHTAGDKDDDGNAIYKYTEPTEAELRWQMAVGMAFGAKNLTHYTYASHEDDYSTMVEYDTWNTTALFDRVKKINTEYEKWDNIYNSFTWQGYAALDFGSTKNSLTARHANAMMSNLDNDIAVNAIGGLSAVNMADGENTSTSNNAKDLLVGLFTDDGENKAFMLTNAGSAPDTYTSSSKYYANLTYSMVDIEVTLTFDAGYAGVIVIDEGVQRYETLTNNQLTLTIGQWKGVFVIPVKAQTQLSSVTGLAWSNDNVLTWNAVSDANAYEVVITRNGEDFLSTTVTSNSLDLGDKVLGEYVVTVYAKNDGKAMKSVAATLNHTIALR